MDESSGLIRRPVKKLNPKSKRSMGTFGGVYSPVTLGMLSTVIFLRIGYAVGNNGIYYSLLQIGISFLIVLFTVFSICAISTNGMISGGGTYYMISRTLGPELGGVIGIMLYLGQIVAASLYVMSAVEVIFQNYSDYLISGEVGFWQIYLYGTFIAGFCLIVSLVGGKLFSRVTNLILLIAVICVSSVVVSFVFQKPKQVLIPRNNIIVYPSPHSRDVYANFTGLSLTTCRNNLKSDYSTDYTILSSTPSITSFGIIFAVFFTGMTGITNGANLSGELSNPSFSIPVGTLISCLSVTFLYVLLIILTGCSCDRFFLQNDYDYMKDINIVPWLVIVGQFATCVSASLASFFGGTRILKAIADDDIFWNYLSFIKRSVLLGNPIGSVLTSYSLVQLFMLIGSLDAIAPLSTTIFLICYCALNFSCMVLDVASAPNFRPMFKYFHWSTCLVGMVSCIFMMFVVSPLYSGICITIFAALTALLQFRTFTIDWGHIGQALIFHQVRKYLLLLDNQKYHIKFWRPQILLFISSPQRSDNLILSMNLLKKSGLLITSHVFIGDFDTLYKLPLKQADSWREYIKKLNVKAFPELTVAHSLSEGVLNVTLLSGLGAMKPNIIAMGFFTPNSMGESPFSQFGTTDIQLYSNPTSWTGLEEYISTLNRLIEMGKSVCLLRNFDDFEVSTSSVINLWLLDFFGPSMSSEDFYNNANINFMLQMGCIFKMVRNIRPRGKINLFLPYSPQTDFAVEEKHVGALLASLRIKANICWVSEDEYFSARGLMGTNGAGCDVERVVRMINSHQSSVITNMIQLPIPPRNVTDYQTYYESLDQLTRHVKNTILLYSNYLVTTTQF